jgi:pimeloyl-ACP methyl ester carboxylesterase
MKLLKIAILSSLLIITASCASKSKGFNEELVAFKYPFEVKTFNLNSQNQNLSFRYMDIGDKKSSKVIVLLHGKNFSGYYWEKIAKHLVKNKYRVIIPDQIGFGKSSKPKAYQYSFGQLALNTKRLLESLKISKADIVGHSMGGMLAVTFIVNYSKSVNKLILINPIGLENYGAYAKFKDVNFFYKRELGKTLDKTRNYQKRNYYGGEWNEEYEKLLVPLKGMLASSDWESVAWSNALTYGPIFSENIVSKLSLIKNKTFLIIGTRDKTGPGRGWLKDGEKRKLGQYKKLGKSANKLIKNSVLLELDGLGHMPHFENYDLFIKSFNIALKR